MAFNNLLTPFKLQLTKHVRQTFTFKDYSSLDEASIKAYVKRYTSESAIPIPPETYEWISTYFKYVKDKDQLLVYDNTSGLWRFENDDSSLVNMLTDYFSIVANEALSHNDQIMFRYAKHFFQQQKVPQLAKRIKTSIAYAVGRSDEIVSAQEHYRYFETTDGGHALIDMRKDTFEPERVTFKEVQPLMLLHRAPMPIHTTDDKPTLFLSLIEEYMLHDPVLIEYFHKVLAYMMSPYNYNQVLLYWIGESGRNGKGTMTKVLQDILGPHAIRMNADMLNSQPHVSFKKDDTLAASEGRSLLIFNEIDERMIASTQNIKDLTEGGRDEFGNKIWTVVRPAYSRAYEVNICGTPLVIANSLINFGDWTQLDPIFKRLILVPFDFKITKEDPTLLNRLAAEYPKIQTWLYMNYFAHKGIRLKDVPKPPQVDRLFIQYRDDSDIIGMFWSDCIEDDPNSKVLRSDLYRMYKLYCDVNGRKAIKNKGTNGFANLIKSHITSEFQSNGQWYVKGIKETTYFEKEISPFAR